MADETRSLWEIYDSEIEPWRRGRRILLAIGAFVFLLQGLSVMAEMVLGRLEVLVVLGILIVVFWLQFYFVWIGVHWLRWVWGGWNLLSGFALLIWALRDQSVVESLLGVMNILVGAGLCSPSVYLFAKHQKETIRWKESVIVAAVSFVSLVTVAGAGLGAWALREQYRRDARAFADDAGEHIYREHDEQWTLAHVSQRSLQQNGPERVRYFLEAAKQRIGRVQQIRHADGIALVHLSFPFALETDAETIAYAETERGAVQLCFVLLNSHREWQIDRMWWNYLPASAKQETRAP
ncbi:MAG: hypothetical protein DLM52_09840 [Chthoniobacterales bacterium]|nr:MAG: hypothetical protein DLM52_09840 [Chthoniobacterales bacterium]